MKVLIVCSKNWGKIRPFISEQVDSLSEQDIETDWFYIEEKGINGYIKMVKKFYQKCNESNPDIIHAHYGYCGFIANLQRKIPVITTYPGSDINFLSRRIISFFSLWLSKRNIFMSNKQFKKVKLLVSSSKNYIIPYGIDYKSFYLIEKNKAKEMFGLSTNKKYALFAGKFYTAVKNAPLAINAVNKIEGIELLELTGTYSREEMCILMNAVDVAIMTSFSEGSPQFIKEVLLCNCPVVSTDVGDVREVIENMNGCYITTYEEDDVAKKIEACLSTTKNTSTIDYRNSIIDRYGLDVISKRIVNVYKSVI